MRSTRTGATSSGCTRAAGSAPRTSASGPRSCSGRCSTRRTPTPAGSTRRSSCSCAAGATCATRSRCSCPRRGRATPISRPAVRDFYRYHACLTEPWDGPAGLVFTDGRRVGAALDRNGLRPLRWSAAADGTVVCASEAGAVPLDGRGCGAARPARVRARCCASTPSAGGVQTNDDDQGGAGRRAPPYRDVGAARPAHAASGRARRSSPATRTRSPRTRSRSASPRRRSRRSSSRWRPTPRSRRSRWATTRRSPPLELRAATGVPLPEATVRAGEQPADRPPARAPGDVAADLPRAAPAAAQRGLRRRAAARAPDLPRHPVGRWRICSTRTGRRCAPARLDATFAAARRARTGWPTRSPAWPTRPTSTCAAGVELLVISDAAPTIRAGPRADPDAARDRRGASPAGAQPAPPGRLDRRRRRRRARRARGRRACSATAPTRSARGSRSRPSPAWPTPTSSARSTRTAPRRSCRSRSRTAC